MNFRAPIFTTITFLLLHSICCGQDDLVASKLDKATEDYHADTTKLEETAAEWFSKQEAHYRKRGNRVGLKKIEADRNAFHSEARLPKEAPRSLRRMQAKINSKMEASYRDAMRKFTVSGNEQKAKETEKALSGFLKAVSDSPIRSAWKHDKGLFEIAGPGVWKETISDGRTFAYKELTRTEDFVEIEATSGNTDVRLRLYSDHGDIGSKTNLKFKTLYRAGKWLTQGQ